LPATSSTPSRRLFEFLTTAQFHESLIHGPGT
jgi:hypothetical protein